MNNERRHTQHWLALKTGCNVEHQPDLIARKGKLALFLNRLDAEQENYMVSDSVHGLRKLPTKADRRSSWVSMDRICELCQ
jgi:hypothetical protein